MEEVVSCARAVPERPSPTRMEVTSSFLEIVESFMAHLVLELT
jgi:hypothetical protein